MSAGGLHLLVGPDRARKLQRIHDLERSLGVQPLDRHQLDATSASASRLLALCRQRPAESPLRLIVVDEAHRLDRACAEALLQHAETIAATALVVLLVETEFSVRHPLAHAKDAMRTERFPVREGPAAKPFALTDALGRGDAAAALTALREQLSAGKEPLELLGLVAWQLNRWVVVRRFVNLGYDTERIGSATRIAPWQVQRLQSEVTDRSLASLQRLLGRCWQLDVEAKSGQAIPELAVEQLVVEVCQPVATI